METGALIAALILGAIGFVAFIGIGLYSAWRVDRDRRRRLTGEDLRLLNSLYLVAGALLVGGLVVGVSAGSAGILVAALLIGAVSAAFLLVLVTGTWRLLSRGRSRRS
jgi:hypothetical protein